MDRLWALKKEFDPFKWIIPGIGAIGILPIFRCTFYRCPYCRWPFKTAWGPSNSFLGSGERACWHCRQVFWGGSQEWPEMSNTERMQFLFPISVSGYLGAFLVIGGIYLCGVFFWRIRPGPGELIFFADFFLPIGFWLCFRIAQVIRSVRRYNKRGESGPA
jgi:hypothetical protein